VEQPQAAQRFCVGHATSNNQKKWLLRRAAKFREETPRKGGGLAIEDRNTALQQYGEKTFPAQAEIRPPHRKMSA